jgi:hypothetical protein
VEDITCEECALDGADQRSEGRRTRMERVLPAGTIRHGRVESFDLCLMLRKGQNSALSLLGRQESI